MTDRFQLPRSTPEAQGISSRTVQKWVSLLDELEHPHGFMLSRHGTVIAEGWWTPYGPEVPHQLFSLSKSFLSVAVGWAIREGRLGLEDRVCGFFPEEKPRHSQERFAQMTVRHLLTMSSGHSEDVAGQLRYAASGDYFRAFFDSTLDYDPGTRFVYNSVASYMLSAILNRVTGETLVDYLNPRLLHPLNIQNAFWESCPRGIAFGGWGLYLTTGEVACFAEAIRAKGLWEGREVIPTEYLELATSWQIDNSMNENPDWKLGYGFHFWRGQHQSFRGDGAFGQYALVVPEAGLVLAMNSGMANMQSVLTLVWEVLLPGLHNEALPGDPEALRELSASTASLALPIAGPCAAQMHEARERVAYQMAENSAGVRRVALAFSGEACSVTLETATESETFRAGYGKNFFGVETLFYQRPRKVACSAAWKSPTHLQVICHYYETPFCVTFDFQLHGAELTFVSQSSLQFGTTDWEPLKGTRLL